MSARDAESGSSTYRGGSRSAGGLGNGGLGGGMGGGAKGGGAARNGGVGNRTGLTTGNKMVGIPGRDGLTFSGRPGGFAQQPGAWGITPAAPISSAPLAGAVPGILGPAAPVPAGYTEPVVADVPTIQNPFYQKSLYDVAGFIEKMRQQYTPQPAFTPPPGMNANNYLKNPTAYPQWGSGWGTDTNNYLHGNTYPGGTNYTMPNGVSGNFSNNFERSGVDSMARTRGY